MLCAHEPKIQSLLMAIATDHNGDLKMVLSLHGLVVFEIAVPLLHDATQKNYASALRLLAETIDKLPGDMGYPSQRPTETIPFVSLVRLPCIESLDGRVGILIPPIINHAAPSLYRAP
jgi:hypothetical protein